MSGVVGVRGTVSVVGVVFVVGVIFLVGVVICGKICGRCGKILTEPFLY